MEYKTLFILGFPRSGTSLLMRYLSMDDNFPDAKYDETHYFSHYYKRFGNLKKEKNRNLLFKEVVKSKWVKNTGIDHHVVNDIVNKVNVSYESVFNDLMQYTAQKQNKKYWLEKTPWHVLYLPEISKYFKKSKFVFIIRDPRAVVQSIQRLGWSSKSFQGSMRIAAAWRFYNLFALKWLNIIHNSSLIINYEDFILNTTDVTKKINNFIGFDLKISDANHQKLGLIGGSNSAFDERFNGLSQGPVYRWKQTHHKILAEIEYMTKIGDSLFPYYQPFSSFRLSYPSRIAIQSIYTMYKVNKYIRSAFFPLIRK